MSDQCPVYKTQRQNIPEVCLYSCITTCVPARASMCIQHASGCYCPCLHVWACKHWSVSTLMLCVLNIVLFSRGVGLCSATSQSPTSSANLSLQCLALTEELKDFPPSQKSCRCDFQAAGCCHQTLLVYSPLYIVQLQIVLQSHKNFEWRRNNPAGV